jgi:hypothetical protein
LVILVVVRTAWSNLIDIWMEDVLLDILESACEACRVPPELRTALASYALLELRCRLFGGIDNED